MIKHVKLVQVHNITIVFPVMMDIIFKQIYVINVMFHVRPVIQHQVTVNHVQTTNIYRIINVMHAMHRV